MAEIKWHSMLDRPGDKIDTYILAVQKPDKSKTTVIGLWSNRSYGSHGDLLDAYKWYYITPQGSDPKDRVYAWAEKPGPPEGMILVDATNGEQPHEV